MRINRLPSHDFRRYCGLSKLWRVLLAASTIIYIVMFRASWKLTNSTSLRPAVAEDATQSSLLTSDHCSCKVTPELLPPYNQNPLLEYGTGARILFLLGYPYTGTSAAHYLLGTSGNVSTLTQHNYILGPKQEGWEILGLKKISTGPMRWNGRLEWVSFTDLAEQYWQMWDTEKPLLIENSPPEIQQPQALMDAFSVYGKVRFVMLVRGDCTSSDGDKPYHTNVTRAAGYRNVETLFPKDTFVLRYEDLCLRWNDIYEDLVRWEPLLADVNITSKPGQGGDGKHHGFRGHAHNALSIAGYCHEKRHHWMQGLPNKCHQNCTKEWFELSALYGYDKIDEQSCI